MVHLGEKRLFPVLQIPRNITWRYKTYYVQRVNKATTAAALKCHLADIFHMTYYDISILPSLRCPFVVTVHDMIPEMHPYFFTDAAAVHPNKKSLCVDANAVICVSGNTKADLIRLFNIDPQKIFVTHHEIARDWGEPASFVPGLPDEFLLFVGNRENYKNFFPVVDALTVVKRRFPDLHLVCAGGGPFTRIGARPFNRDDRAKPRTSARRN